MRTPNDCLLTFLSVILLSVPSGTLPFVFVRSLDRWPGMLENVGKSCASGQVDDTSPSHLLISDSVGKMLHYFADKAGGLRNRFGEDYR